VAAQLQVIARSPEWRNRFADSLSVRPHPSPSRSRPARAEERGGHTCPGQSTQHALAPQLKHSASLPAISLSRYRNFNVVSATAQKPARRSKPHDTFDSLQPSNRNGMDGPPFRKMRLPRNLNEAHLQNHRDGFPAQKRRQRKNNRISCLMMTAITPSVPPSESDPTSP